MNIVALCKTFAGHEWIIPSTLSVYPYITNIVFVNSEISWNGRHGNSCKPKIQYMLEHLDPDNKIITLDHDTIDQFAQCMHGYKWIQENLPDTDYVLLIDTDEVWNNHDLEVAIEHIKIYHGDEYDFYKTNLYTYIKSPLFQVTPHEPLEPVSFVKANLPDLGEHARCCDSKFHPRTKLLRDTGDENKRLFYHHYVYVREEFNTVLEKIVTSHVSEHRFYQPMDIWIPEVWNKIEQGFSGFEGIWEDGFHPAIGFRRNWKGLKEIRTNQMPKVLRENNFPILEQYGVRN